MESRPSSLGDPLHQTPQLGCTCIAVDDGWGEAALQVANDTVDKGYVDDDDVTGTVDDDDDSSWCHNAVERRNDGDDVAIRGIANDNQIADTAEEQEEETVAAAAYGNDNDDHDTDVHLAHDRDDAGAGGCDDDDEGVQVPWVVVHH